MDLIITTIDEALRRKGLSDAAASTMAVGHPSLIKNLRMPRKGEKRYNLPSLQKLAKVLDLEFYFGPKRNIPGFSEGDNATDLGRTEALRGGYAPIPWHPQAGQIGSSPVAFSRAWMNDRSIEPDHLRAVRVDDSEIDRFQSIYTVVVVDTAARRTPIPRLWVASWKGKLRLTPAEFHAHAVLLPGLGPAGSAEFIMAPSAPPVLGAVVWIGALCTPPESM